MTRKEKIAVIGTGRMGSVHVPITAIFSFLVIISSYLPLPLGRGGGGEVGLHLHHDFHGLLGFMLERLHIQAE